MESSSIVVRAVAIESVDQTIRARRTEKVLAPHALNTAPAADSPADWDWLIAAAHWAPFHRPAHSSHLQTGMLTGIVPWRLHLLSGLQCRQLRDRLAERECGKIREMLAAADLLVFFNWLPNPAAADTPPTEPADSAPAPRSMFEPTLENMEHIAAAGAAIQNILLAATARGIPNYWSSGGILREPFVQSELGIPPREILLGALFLFPTDTAGQATSVFSKLREQRSPAETWTRWITLHQDIGS